MIMEIIIAVIIAVTAGLGVYFLPSILARKDKNFGKIFFLNLLGAWTGILWFAALGWAIFYKDPRHLKGKEKEQWLLNIIQEKGGRVTPLEIAAETKMSLDQAKEELDGFCNIGAAELQITDAGNSIYVFRGFLTYSEKMSSKSPLEV